MNRPFWLFRTSASLDNCETIEPLLSLAADGMASAEETQRLDAHLPGCEGCRAALSWMQATHATLTSRPVAVPPPDLRSRLALAIALSSRPAAVPPPDLHSRIALAIAASAAAPVSLRPARVFTLRTVYAAAASLTALGIALSYPLWHTPDEVAATKHSVKPSVLAAAPSVKTIAAPKTTRPLVASRAVKPAAVKHTITVHETAPTSVTRTEHTASNTAPMKLLVTPPVVITLVHHTSSSPQVASRILAPTEKHSIEHSPLPTANTAVLKLPEGPRLAKVIKEPLRLDLPTPKITSDATVLRTVSTHRTASSNSDDPFGFGRLKADLKAQNAVYVPVNIVKQGLSRGATSAMQTVRNDERTAFISAVHGNQ